MTRLRLLVAVVALLASASGGFAVDLADLKPKIDALVEPLIKSETTIGLSIGIIDGTQTKVFGYGRVSCSTNKVPDGRTLFEIGSITKTFTSLLLADMAEEKLVQLDDPVDKYLPDAIKLARRGDRAITLLDLATHTSGLPRLPQNFVAVEVKHPENPYACYTLEELYLALPTCALASAPGTKFAYSNLGAGLLGHVLARRAGTSYEALVQRRICEPLGMKDTRIALSVQQRLRFAEGHNADGLPVPAWDIPSLAGAGALRSTVDDLLLYLSAQLGMRPSRLSRAIEATHLPRHDTGAPAGKIGLAWFTGAEEKAFWHNGQTGGYHSHVAFHKPRKIGVVILGNTAGGTVDRLAEELMKLLSGKPVAPIKVRMPVRVEPAVLDRYVGNYEITPSFALAVFRDGERLVVQASGQPRLRVFAESETKFWYRVVDAQITFVKDDDGQVNKLILHQHGIDLPAWKGGIAGQLSKRAMQALFARPAGSVDKSAPRPNVVFILADDLGYADLGCYGQRKIKTPNLDRMAAEGIRFTSAYCGTSVCAPSRCALLTGLHMGHAPVRANREIQPEGQMPLPEGTLTVAQLFKSAGYRTACIGKWGLGMVGTSGDPLRNGFDHFFGYNCQRKAHEYYPEYLWRNRDKVALGGQQYSHDRIAAEALDWVRQSKDRPFFLYLPFTIPHAKYQSPDLAPYQSEDWPETEKTYAAMVTRMDRDVGRLLALLKELKLDEKTLVFFASDNGAAGGSPTSFFQNTGPWRDIKRSMYEGGLRVPMIARWPGHVPPGKVSDEPWAFWDFLPTCASLAGQKLPEGAKTDGLSVVPALLGGKAPPRECFYWELYEGRFQQALRMGDWKAVRPGPGKALELYDLKSDPAEKNDLAASQPAIVAKAEALMKAAHSNSPQWPTTLGTAKPKAKPGKTRR